MSLIANLKERVCDHLLNDTLKLLMECSNSLRHTIKRNNKVGIDTDKDVYSWYSNDQTDLDLTKMTLSKPGR